jgi:hypothetical protein
MSDSRGPWLAGGFPKTTLATSDRSLPFRSRESVPRSTGRFVEPPRIAEGSPGG